MLDLSQFGDYQHDVVFDFSFATDLAHNLRSMATKVMSYDSSCTSAANTAYQDFSGAYANTFRKNIGIEHADAQDLAEVLNDTAAAVDILATSARKENLRRQHIREYASKHDDWWEGIVDFFAGSGIPAFPEEARHENILVEFTATNRQANWEATGPATGVSSGNPENLRSASQIIISANDAVTGVAALIAALAEFPQRCQYGGLGVGDLGPNLKKWKEANANDAQWLRIIGDAFEAAGGTATMAGVVSDDVLAAALAAAGVNETRTDLNITAPELLGFDPATGYVLDPVNAATGNFIEPEVDCAFSGTSRALKLSRMYNSFDTSPGVFGVGWSSTLDQKLHVEADKVTWVREDGRHIVFPRFGEGFGRAERDNLWLENEELSDFPFMVQKGWGTDNTCRVVRNNMGETWVFNTRGVWLGTTCGEGTSIRVDYTSEGEVCALVS